MATYLLEVGTEELPSSFVTDALRQWRDRIPASLDEAFLPNTDIQYFGTPRRLAVVISGLPDRQSDRLVESKGPAVTSAFKNGDPNAEPTKALLGFAKSRGVNLEDLQIKQTDKGEFVFAQQQVTGLGIAEILPPLAQIWVTGLEGKRLMRWGNGDMRFPRPIRWLVSLLDEQILPITLENLKSNRQSWGHRVLHSQPVAIASAQDYVKTMTAASVMVDIDQRRQKICEQIKALAELMGAKADVLPDLLEEVTQLVEFPTAIVGEFEREYLQLPTEVIETEMVSHQRYFPLYAIDSETPKLLPYFITISNGDPAKSKLIALGNGRVIRARLADGKFFYDSDRQQPLEAFLPQLEKVTFQEQLGSVSEKVNRLGTIAESVVAAIANFKVSDAQKSEIQRTAKLCKADLVSQMVKEFPELQGTIGQYYAQASGETDLVSTGIREHYLPRGAGDRLPQTLTGQIVAISDRLDSLVGIFGLGIIPTGSSDPFALRRAASGIVQIIWDCEYALDLPQLIASTIAIYGEKKNVLTVTQAQLQASLEKWFEQRARTLLQESGQEPGIDYDLVDAVFGVEDPEYSLEALRNLTHTRDRAQFLQAARNDNGLNAVLEVVNRATRLAAQGNLDRNNTDLAKTVSLKSLKTAAEQDLYQAIKAIPKNPSFAILWQHLTAIAPVLASFFDQVMVMDEDLEVRQNRLNLLGILRNHSLILGDFSAIR
jgi:glycyl-tRNA synthetase beta chain